MIVDELQDLDACQRRLVVKLCGGDPEIADPARQNFTALLHGRRRPHQAIYAWRGADKDSMERCREELDCDVLPPRSATAAPRHTSIRAPVQPRDRGPPWPPSAPSSTFATALRITTGTTIRRSPSARRSPKSATRGDRARRITADLFQAGDAVICRKNAPLVTIAYWLMRNRVPCKLLGRDFGAGLIAAVEATRATEADEAIRRMKLKLEKSEERDREDKTLDGEPSEATAKLRDSIDVLVAIVDNLLERHGDAERPVSTGELCAELNHLFGDGAADPSQIVTLCSIHKARGEWPRVGGPRGNRAKSPGVDRSAEPAPRRPHARWTASSSSTRGDGVVRRGSLPEAIAVSLAAANLIDLGEAQVFAHWKRSRRRPGRSAASAAPR